MNVNVTGSLSDCCDLSVFIYCGDCLVVRGVAVSGGVVLSEELLSLDLRNGIRPDPGGRPGLQCVTVLLDGHSSGIRKTADPALAACHMGNNGRAHPGILAVHLPVGDDPFSGPVTLSVMV